MTFYYTVYGLPVVSEILLPELGEPEHSQTQNSAEPVYIELGVVPQQLPESTVVTSQFEYTSSECIYRIEEIASYRISTGSQITVEITEGAQENDVRAYLFGSVFAAAIHQRKLLPLHVSAVKSPFGAAGFTGNSGAGKSTLAATLHKATGWPIFCDDVAVVHPEDPDMLLHAGLVRQKLWTDAIERLGLQKAYQFRDTTRDDKFHVFDQEMFSLDATTMKALFVIEKGQEVAIDAVNGADAFAAITKSIHRPELVTIFNDKNSVLERCLDIAQKTDVYRFTRPWDEASLTGSTNTLRDFLKSRFTQQS